jgi:hypothetical protein
VGAALESTQSMSEHFRAADLSRRAGADREGVRYSYTCVTSFFAYPPLKQPIPIRIFLNALLLSNRH